MAVVAETFATLAETTATADPGAAGTSLAATSRTAFPQSGQCHILVQDSETDKTNREIMLVTAGFGTGAGSFTVTRGIEGTTGVAHAIGSYIAQVLTADAQKRWVPEYVWQPRHENYLLEDFDASQASANSALVTTLRPNLFKVYVPETMTLANLHCSVGVIGATLTAGSNEGGVYTSAGTLIGRTGTQATAWTSLGLKTMALTVIGGQSLTVVGGPGVFVWLALLASGTTVPGFLRLSSTPTSADHNGLLSAANGFRCGTLVAVTSGTGLPLSFTPSTALSISNVFAWAAAS